REDLLPLRRFQSRHGVHKLQRELIEERSREPPLNSRSRERVSRLMRQLDVSLRQVAQSRAAHQREIDSRGQRAQRMIGADVRGRAFAADMLLASIERQAKRAATIAITSLSDEASRHIAEMGRARGHEADARSAVLKRQSETLPLADCDIDA